jgi:hypothetical protein
MIQIVPTYEPARREPIYRKAIELYARRPDLQGQLYVALGDDFLAQGRKDLALKAYQDVYTSKLRELTEVFLIASRRAGDMMVDAQHRDDAIALYRKLFGDAHPPANRNGAYHQTAYYQLGKRLAELLQEDSKGEEARQILQRIGEDNGPPEARS